MLIYGSGSRFLHRTKYKILFSLVGLFDQNRYIIYFVQRCWLNYH